MNLNSDEVQPQSVGSDWDDTVPELPPLPPMQPFNVIALGELPPGFIDQRRITQREAHEFWLGSFHGATEASVWLVASTEAIQNDPKRCAECLASDIPRPTLNSNERMPGLVIVPDTLSTVAAVNFIDAFRAAYRAENLRVAMSESRMREILEPLHREAAALRQQVAPAAGVKDDGRKTSSQSRLLELDSSWLRKGWVFPHAQVPAYVQHFRLK